MFIEANNLKKTYGKDAQKINALDGATLEIEKGETVVILGPSGSGKSTLMNIIGGIDSATSGSIVVDGKSVNKMNNSDLVEYRRQNIGFIFQTYNLVSDLTAKENVQLMQDISTDTFPVDEILHELGIEKYADHFPKEMSGGQQQRVAIARAVVKKPKILLCDEPTAALDSKTSQEVLALIEKMSKSHNITVIIVTHNELIAQIADRIIKLKDGKIIKNDLNDHKISASRLEL
jgi:putative ABC transport system ATP-binding protein